MLVAASELFRTHFEHCLAALLLVARLADVVSTRIATPTLRLEANPLARKLGWPFAWATLLVCLLPYYEPWGPVMALALIIVSLFVAASNFSRAWVMRAIGEEEYLAFTLRAYAKTRPAAVYASIAAWCVLTASVGLLLMLLYPQPDEWAHYFAWGIWAYVIAIAVHSSLFARRMFRASAVSREAAPAR